MGSTGQGNGSFEGISRRLQARRFSRPRVEPQGNLIKVGGKDSDSVVSSGIARVQHLPQGVLTSLTRARRTELAYHRKFTIATDVCVYFCNPKSPWQRGSNENTNGLQRQNLPNGTDLGQ